MNKNSIPKYSFVFLFACLLLVQTSCREEKDATEAVIAAPAEPKNTPKQSRKYVVDTLASYIEWAGSKPTGTHTGTIMLNGGKLYVKDSILESGTFRLNMTSITVTDQTGEKKLQLESHLKGLGKEGDADHFFNTAKYPVGTFEITGVANNGQKQMIEGNLTLKDITQNIAFPAEVIFTDTLVTLVSEPFKINRTLWKINYSSKSAVQNLGDKYIDDAIEIKVNLKAVRRRR